MALREIRGGMELEDLEQRLGVTSGTVETRYTLADAITGPAIFAGFLAAGLAAPIVAPAIGGALGGGISLGGISSALGTVGTVAGVAQSLVGNSAPPGGVGQPEEVLANTQPLASQFNPQTTAILNQPSIEDLVDFLLLPGNEAFLYQVLFGG